MAITTQEQLHPELRGMKPWERSKYLAELRRKEQETKMKEFAGIYGEPGIVGAEGTMREFTMPSGVKRTFTEGGDQVSLELPEHYTNIYSPRDQRKIEQLYQVRSQAATDPESTEDERQRAIDKIDAQLSRIPKLSPIMREPTPQQKFDASMVTAPDGTKGYVDKSGNFKPFEASKLAQEEEKEYRTYYGKQLAEMTKENEKLKESQSPSVIADRARWMSDLAFGRVQERPNNAKLDLLWQGTMTRLQAWGTYDWGRINSENMYKGMKVFINEALEKYDISESEAKYDFMNRWSRANDGGEYSDILPKLSDKERHQSRYVGVTTALENDLNLANFDDDLSRKYGLKRGEGRVTVEPDLPPELEAIFPNLDNEDKRAIRQKLDEGWTVTEVLTAIGKAG